MIKINREPLTGLARLNTAVAPVAMCIMNGTASIAEQHNYAQRLIAAGKWLQRRADKMRGTVVDGEVLNAGPLTLPAHIVEFYSES